MVHLSAEALLERRPLMGRNPAGNAICFPALLLPLDPRQCAHERARYALPRLLWLLVCVSPIPSACPTAPGISQSWLSASQTLSAQDTNLVKQDTDLLFVFHPHAA
jgi:hypothetical protein